MASSPSIAAQRTHWPLAILIAVLAVSTVAGAAVTNGNAIVAMAPSLVVLIGYALWKLPLKVPCFILTIICLALDNPIELLAHGLYKSPLYTVAALLELQLKHTIPIGALVFTGMDVMFVILFGIHFYRRMTNSTLDREAFVPLPSPLIGACWLSLVTVSYNWLWGLVTGGSSRFALWQVQHTMYMPIAILLFNAALPNPRSFRTLERIIVGCATFKAILAAILARAFAEEVKTTYATTHADSMLFATAICILLARFIERPNKKSVLAFWPIPVIVEGMIANNRRLVWVELSLSCVCIFVITPWSRLKVRLIRGVLASVLPIAGYLAAGWNSGAGIFKPVVTIRSLFDAKADLSTLWRDLENFNLVTTLGHHPIIGTGWGHPYEAPAQMFDITSAYELEPYLPHNSLLGFWAFTGVVGFTLFWALIVVANYFAARSYFFARDPEERATALACFCSLLIYALQCYGDLGLGTWASVFMEAPFIVIVGRLAVQRGGWQHVGFRSNS